MINVRFSTTLLLLLSNMGASQTAEESVGDTCSSIEALGTPKLDRFNFQAIADANDDCGYDLEITFQHDQQLPVPSDPAAQCNPAIQPPEIAADGLPYFADRWHYQELPEDDKKATGIDHISIDWNPCGHPPADKFGAPHYDVHLYRVSPEYRTCMTCANPPGAPICDPTPGSQTTPSGIAFFDFGTVDITSDQPPNLPEEFVVGMTAMVPHMGGHARNELLDPTSALEWFKPSWVMAPFNGTIVNYETMIPMSFFSGNIDNLHTEDLSYVAQTIVDLPSSYSVAYSGASSKVINFTLTGTTAECVKKEDEPESTEEKDPASNTENASVEKKDSPYDDSSAHSAWAKTWLATIALAFFL